MTRSERIGGYRTPPRLSTSGIRSDEPDLRPQLVTELVERVRPLFAGQGPAVVGAALADLVAIWLASHVVEGDAAETDALRGRLMLSHTQAVRRLTAINAEELGT